MKIEVPKYMANYVPGSVFAQTPFALQLQDFSAVKSASRAHINRDTQMETIQEFITSKMNLTFIVTDKVLPADAHKKAMYFATYLMEKHSKHLGIESSMHSAAITDGELDTYTGTFWNPGRKREDIPTCLLLHHVSEYPTNVQVEKVRDLMATWSCPVIIQGTGCNPLELANRLHVACHGAAYIVNEAKRVKV